MPFVMRFGFANEQWRMSPGVNAFVEFIKTFDEKWELPDDPLFTLSFDEEWEIPASPSFTISFDEDWES